MSEKIKKILALLLLTDGTGTETGNSQKKMSLTRQSQLIARMPAMHIQDNHRQMWWPQQAKPASSRNNNCRTVLNKKF